MTNGNRRFIPEDAEVGCIPPERLMMSSGLELFDDMLAGRLPPPPIARLMNFNLTAAGDGFAEFRGIPLFDHYNPAGSVHGGWPATVLDSALGCAVQTKLPAATGFTTVEFKVNLVRPISKDTGEVVCRADVVHLGRTLAVSEATLKSPDGKLLAMGTETCAIFPLDNGRR